MGPPTGSQPQGGEQMAPPPWLQAVRAGGWEALLFAAPHSPLPSPLQGGLGFRGTPPPLWPRPPCPQPHFFAQGHSLSVSTTEVKFGVHRDLRATEDFHGRPLSVHCLAGLRSKHGKQVAVRTALACSKRAGQLEPRLRPGLLGWCPVPAGLLVCLVIQGSPPGPAAPPQAGEEGERVPRAVLGLHLVPQLDPEFAFLGPSPFGLLGDSQGLCCHGYNTPTHLECPMMASHQVSGCLAPCSPLPPGRGLGLL